MRDALTAAGYPSLVYGVSEEDPLATFGMECLPLVTTPLGNLSRPFDKLLKRLAVQAVHYHQSSLPSPLPPLAHKIRRNMTHKRYRASVACATVTALVHSFSADQAGGHSYTSYRNLVSRRPPRLGGEEVMVAVRVGEGVGEC